MEDVILASISCCMRLITPSFASDVLSSMPCLLAACAVIERGQAGSPLFDSYGYIRAVATAIEPATDSTVWVKMNSANVAFWLYHYQDKP